MTANELNFTRYAVDSVGSLSVVFEKASTLSGIHCLDLSDGTSYIGQSVNLRSRLATHRRRWAGKLAAFSYAPCPTEMLDEAERAMIQRLEREGISLQNKLLARRPQGAADVHVSISEGLAVPLPWERHNRPGEGAWENCGPFVVSASQERNFHRLVGEPEHPQVRQALHAVLAEVIPAPRATAGVMWTVTSMSSTGTLAGYRRLCTLNAGRLEILSLTRGKQGQSALALLNLAVRNDRKTVGRLTSLARSHGCLSVDRVNYSQHMQVWFLLCPLGSVGPLLRVSLVAGLVYELVIVQIRTGMNPLRKHFNPLLFEDVWAESENHAADAVEV